MTGSSNGARKCPISTPPSAKDTLRASVSYWLQTSEGQDQELNLRDPETTRRIAVLYYGDALKDFEPFLYEAGLTHEEEIKRFKREVIGRLASQNFLEDDPSLLPNAIAETMISFDFGKLSLNEIIKHMETAYKTLLPEDMRDDQPYVKGGLFLLHDLIARIVNLNR